MNGVITKSKLQELLKEYHNIDFSIKELDNIVKEIGAITIKNKYYTWLSDIPMNHVDAILKIKDSFDKYQKVDFRKDDKEEFEEKLHNIIESNLTNIDEIESVYSMVHTSCKSANLKKDFFNEVLEYEGIVLNEKAKKQIFDLYKEYKRYISVWIYNGYTVLEYADIINNKTFKVGRNDLCPCGSGKKYKKCCGK